MAYKKSLDDTLACRDEEITKEKTDSRDYKAADNELRLYAKQKIEDKENLCKNSNNKYKSYKMKYSNLGE